MQVARDQDWVCSIGWFIAKIKSKKCGLVGLKFWLIPKCQINFLDLNCWISWSFKQVQFLCCLDDMLDTCLTHTHMFGDWCRFNGYGTLFKPPSESRITVGPKELWSDSELQLKQHVFQQGLVNVPIKHHPTIGDVISNRYLKVMFKIPKKGHLPTPVQLNSLNHTWRIIPRIITGE